MSLTSRFLSSCVLFPTRYSGVGLVSGSKRHITYTVVRRNDGPVAPLAAKDVPNDVKPDLKGKQVDRGEPEVKIDGVEEDDKLSFLKRPLGILQRPTTVARSWQEEMIDEQTRKAHREHLCVHQHIA